MSFYLPILLMIASTTLYHFAQKSVPAQINPLASLAINYLTALAGTLLLVPFFRADRAGGWSWKAVNWASIVVGVSIIGIELAVLLAYRAGWKLSLMSVVSNTASALLLIAVGVALFHERLSARNLTGAVLCLAGLALISQG
jgi:drug/metabolite transporter (DMT)-like permease